MADRTYDKRSHTTWTRPPTDAEMAALRQAVKDAQARLREAQAAKERK